MSTISYGKLKVPSDLEVNTLTASSGIVVTPLGDGLNNQLLGVNQDGMFIVTSSTPPDLSGYATLTGVSGTFVTYTAATASLARLGASNIFTANQTVTGSISVSGSISSNTLTGSDTRVIYADSVGTLTTINNDYTYNTANIIATYKTTISGVYPSTISGVFFTTPTNKGKFVPSNCMFFPTNGSLTAGPDISVGMGSGFNGNDLATNTSIGSMVLNEEFIEIPLQTPNGSGSGKCRAAPTGSIIYWKTSGLGLGTTITGTLIMSGYYVGA